MKRKRQYPRWRFLAAMLAIFSCLPAYSASIWFISPTNGAIYYTSPGGSGSVVWVAYNYTLSYGYVSHYERLWVDGNEIPSYTDHIGPAIGPHNAHIELYQVDELGQYFKTAESTVSFTVVAVYNVTVRNSFDAGSVKVDGATYSSGTTFAWVNGEQHTLEAIDGQSYNNYVRHFTDWSGGISSSNISVTLTVSQNTTCTANFLKEFNIGFQNGFTGGVIKVNGVQYNSPTSSFPVLETHTISAEAVNQATNGLQYTFTQWSDGSTSNPHTFTPTGHTTYTANFAVKPIQVTVTSAGGPNNTPVVLTWQVHPNSDVTYDIYLKKRSNGVIGDPTLEASSLPHSTTSYTSPVYINLPNGTDLLYWDVRAYHSPTSTSADPWWTCSGYGTAQPKTIANDATKAEIGEEIQEFAVSNFPNPFNPTTTIRFSLPDNAQVSLEIFNVLGEKVRTLIHGQTYEPGYYNVVWDGKDNNGRTASSGIYFYRIVAGQNVKTVKMLLMK